jgi:hypothetical protein
LSNKEFKAVGNVAQLRLGNDTLGASQLQKEKTDVAEG